MQDADLEIAEADDLTPTISQADNQYRNRNRAASQVQINKIANNLEPELLGDSKDIGTGAPTLANDGKTIIGGNGRMLAIRQSYDNNQDGNYKQYLINNADNFGLRREDIEAMSKPVLVRRLKNNVDVKKMAVSSNEGGGLKMSELEQSQVDADRLPDFGTFHANNSFELNTQSNSDFVRRFVGAMPTTVQAEMVDADGRLSKTGVRRLENALIYRAYGNSPALERLVESTDEGRRNLANSLKQIAPKIAKAKDYIRTKQMHDADISGEIIQAVEKLNQLQETGQSVNDYLAQQSMFADTDLNDVARELVKFLDDNKRSAKAITALLGNYYDALASRGNPNQGDVFNNQQPPTKGELLRQARKQYEQQQGINQDGTESAREAGRADELNQQNQQRPNRSSGDERSLGENQERTETEVEEQTDKVYELNDDFYLTGGNTRYSRSAMKDTHRDKIAQAVRDAVGEHAKQIDVLTQQQALNEIQRQENGNNTRQSLSELDGVAGWYDPATGRIKLIADNVTPRMAQLAAWHELVHRGIDVRGRKDYERIFQNLEEHGTFKQLADAIQSMRKDADDPAARSRLAALEEAAAELFGAVKTGDFALIENRYRDYGFKKIPIALQRGGIPSRLQKLKTQLANLIRRLFGRTHQVTDADIFALMGKIEGDIQASNNQGGSGVGVLRNLIAWHGSPHNFDRFSTKNIGTGEGAQVHGWGLYFSSDKDISDKYYRERLSILGENRISINGKVYNLLDIYNEPDRYISDIEKLSVDILMESDIRGYDMIDGIIVQIDDYEKLKKSVDDNSDNPYKITSELLDDYQITIIKNTLYARAEDVIKAMKLIDDGKVKKVKGQLYRVDIPEIDEMLDENAVFDKQPPKVQDALEEIYVKIDEYGNAPPKDMNGGELYEDLVFENRNRENPEKEASLELLKHGVKGIKYLGEGSRKANRKPIDNYVIFYEDDVNIQEKYFSRVGSNEKSFKETAKQYGGEEAYNEVKANGDTDLNYRQWVQVRTPEFKEWFGDWENDPDNASKVVNAETGEPLVVYHGTSDKFTEFDLSKARRDADIPAFFFSQDEQEAGDYGKSGSYFLNIRQPTEKPSSDMQGTKVREELIKQGYDGTIIDEGDGYAEYAAFNPNQVKSATDNTGTFDADNNDIRYSRTDATKAAYERRIDELFSDEKANRVGVTVLNRSDMLDMLGYGDMPVVLKESKVIDSKYNHANMTAEVWKKIPDWIDNPALVFDSETVKDRLVFVAPEQVRGNPALIILEPKDDALETHLLVNAYDNTDSTKPYGRWLNDGLLRYADKEKAREVVPRTVGLRLSDTLRNTQGRKRILTERNLQGYRKNNPFVEKVDAGQENKRFSRQSNEIIDFSKTGKSDSVWQKPSIQNYSAFKKWLKDEVIDTGLELFADNLVPVLRWTEGLPIGKRLQLDLKSAMYRAGGIRTALNSEAEVSYLKPAFKLMSDAAVEYKMDAEDVKRIVGYWMSARYAKIKNTDLIRQDENAYNAAEKIYNEKQDDKSYNKMLIAKRDLLNRQSDVNNPNPQENKFKRGVAGGYNNAKSDLVVANFEKLIPKKKLEEIAKPLYQLLHHKLDIDLNSGRITQTEYDAFKANPLYVPLTGDNKESDIDDVIVQGQTKINQSRDKALKGRTGSMAEDAIDAIMASLAKS